MHQKGMTMQVESQSQLSCYTEHSFWLLPAEPLKEQLRAIVRQLAKEYDAVDFEPHVTIYCGPFDDDQARTIMHGVASLYSPVELIPVKLEHTSEYTKTLFIQFQESDVVRRMSDAIKDRHARPADYVLNPHLSVLYKTMPLAMLAGICQTFDVPKGPYVFDRLRAIETELPLTRPDQIKRWRTVFECALRQP
jgi:2'-5' RNA ligase